MKIIVSTLYEAVGGSSKILKLASDALRTKYNVVLRAPLPVADSRSTRSLSALSLDTWRRKLGAIPSLLLIFRDEWSFIGEQQPDIVYVHDEPSLYVYGLICKMRRIPVVWHVHMREGDGIRRLIRNALCDAKIFVSGALVARLQKKPWRVVPNPIVIGPVKRKSGGASLVVGMLGSISALKNQECGVRVLHELRGQGAPARLVVFGIVLESAYRAQLDGLIAELGLAEFVDFRGFVAPEQALAEIDVLLACSTYESFGLAVGEALASGVPVVASDIAGHREFADGSTSPMLAISTGANEMAQAVIAVQPDGGLADRVRQRFGIEKFSQAITKFLTELHTSRFAAQ